MKKYILSFYTLFLAFFSFAQVPDISLGLDEKFCDEPDIAFIEFGGTTLAGTYNFLTTNLNCVTGEVSGTVEITQDPNDETVFLATDFSFGLFEACFNIDPPSGNLRWKYENFFITWIGSDNYGETYSFIDFASNGNDWTFTYTNTYGDLATVQLTRIDGEDIPFATIDPQGGANPDLSILWSTGETTPSIEITANGSYSVTVSDLTGNSETASIQITDWNKPHPDLPALLDIYNKSNGSNWVDNEGWRQAFDEDDGCNPCDGNWFGIECENNRVLSIILDDNNLDGQISIALGFLDATEVVSMANNNLTGFIPSQISSGLPLKVLDLSNNQLIGTIPVALTTVSSLEELDLSNNELTEDIPREIGDLNVSFLNIGSNQLTGTIPSELGDIQQLTTFIASSNQLTGTIPTELFTIPNINTIVISNNFLSGTLPENFISNNFARLSVANNNLTGTIPSSYGEMPIIQFNVSFNNLEGEVPDFQNMSPFCFDFSMAGNDFDGSPPMLSATAISQLDLSFNNFEGDIPEAYFNLDFMRNLNLSNNNFTGTIPEQLLSIETMRFFDVSHNNLTGPIPSYIGEVPGFFLVDLSNNDLSGCYPVMDSLCTLNYSQVDTMVTFNNNQTYTFDREAGYDFTNNPKLPWSGFATNLCNGDSEIGAPCDDGDPSTTNDGIVDDCTCDQLLSVHELDGQTLTVYPNPASNVINIDVLDSNNLNANLYNATGQLIKQMDFNISNKVSDLNTGIYILEIRDKTKNISIVEKIIIE